MSVVSAAESSASAAIGVVTSPTVKDVSENVRKCKNFLSTLMKLTSNQPEETIRNVRNLIQDLIDGNVEPKDFTDWLQKELKSSPQPYLVAYLQKSLPLLRQSLYCNEVSIDGIRAPPASVANLGVALLPVSASTQVISVTTAPSITAVPDASMLAAVPVRRQVTTKRSRYHKYRSFRITIVKDATLERIDRNILRNKPEIFEKKKVMFDMRNSDPLYFAETLHNEFPSLQGNEFSLWQLGCTNATNKKKTALIPLPSYIDNAVALFACDELCRSCLYVKLQNSNQLLDMASKVQESYNQDTENRHRKKRKFLLDSANDLESLAYADRKVSQDDDTDETEELNQNKKSQFASLATEKNRDTNYLSINQQQQETQKGQSIVPLDTATFRDDGGQQLSDHTLTLESAQQTRIMDVDYPHQIHMNPSAGFLDLQNNVNDASNLHGMSGPNNEKPLAAIHSPSVLYNVTGTQGSAMNLISTNVQTSWDQSRPIQTNVSLRTDLSEAININVESLTNVITKHMEFLADRIDPDFGLLDIMIASKDLTMAEFHQIRSQPSTIEDRNRKLLQYVIDKNKADNLTAALEKARQMHLVNYLNSDGEFNEEFHEFWPLFNNEQERLIKNRQALIDGLDPSLLIFKMYFKDIINKRQHEFILSKPTNSEKNEVLLEMLRRGSIEQYNQTIECLRELNQDRILNVLQEIREDQMQVIMQQGTKEKKESTKQPMSERKRKKLPHSNSNAQQFQESFSDDFPEKYKSEPVKVHTITIRTEEDKIIWIKGLTILDNELFVVSDLSSEIDVFDSLHFSLSCRLNLKELIDPLDITSCNSYKCLYISNFKEDDHPNEILKVDPNGKLILSWSIGNDKVWGLSVTNESNVLVAVLHENALREYSPDGALIREIKLLTQAGIRDPLHAIKLTTGDFLVSHGQSRSCRHGVCVVDADGNLKKSFGREAGFTIGQMKSPHSLAVDGNGFVMVADQMNNRVLLLDPDLEFKKCIFPKGGKHKLRFPERILLDESNARLFVTDLYVRNSGQIFLFEFK